MWSPRRSAFASWTAVAVVALIALPLPVALSGRQDGHSWWVAPTTTTFLKGGVTLGLGSWVGDHPADPFFAVSVGLTGISPSKHMSLGDYLNSTPFTWFRLSGGGDGYDPTTTTLYQAPRGGGTFVPVHVLAVNLTAFKTWCYSRTPHCEWLGYLPAEENDTVAAVHYANWYHRVLGFPPTYWQFGNEPTAWTHFGKNVTKWSTSDNLSPSDLGYATMVKNYIAAIHAVYPLDQFVGVEASCACSPSFLSTTAAVDGSKVAAMAYHAFPWATNSDTSVAQFLGALRTDRNITNTSAHFRSILTTSCAACATIPVEVGAYQAGPSDSLSPLLSSYAGAPFIAASVIQALESNVSMFTLFSASYLFDPVNGTQTPQGLLYSRILANLTMGNDYALRIPTTVVGGMYGIVTDDGTHRSLLLVNTNTTLSLTVAIPTTVFPVRATGSIFAWSPPALLPTAHRGVTLPGSFVVPPEGILLLNDY